MNQGDAKLASPVRLSCHHITGFKPVISPQMCPPKYHKSIRRNFANIWARFVCWKNDVLLPFAR